jgi:cysteine sulfinate desulfinase/cysteine desulfurase-like protein
MTDDMIYLDYNATTPLLPELERHGWRVTRAGVDADGRVALGPETALVPGLTTIQWSS